MLAAFRSLLESKRSLVTLVTALLELAILFGIWLPAAERGEAGEQVAAAAELFAVIVGILGSVLVAGFSASDTGTALKQVAGINHKGKPLGIVLVDVMVGLLGLVLFGLALASVVR